jgi:hypothetical protein
LLWFQVFEELDAQVLWGDYVWGSVFLRNAILVAVEGKAKERLEWCHECYRKRVEAQFYRRYK